MNNSNSNAAKLADLTFHLLEDCHQKEMRLAERYGLTPSEFRCLRLFNLGEVVNNKDLAKRLNLSPGRLTRIVNGLVEKGYTNREIAELDRRNMRVTLSGKGEEMVSQLNKAYVNIHKEILEDVDVSIHSDLISGMNQLLSALRKWMNKNEEEI
ncbi:MAG: MarR family transcriptional regulator [Calditrichaeota bacterium]|nr:MarR family transcriptional regulator [Calditrichota bacterium]